jgi:hypothetical protein
VAGKSSKNTKKKGGQSRTQQQQQAAARRQSRTAVTGRTQDAPQAAAEPATQQAPAPAPAGDRHYLDVSAIRIQEWLARTPALKLRRGASVLLSQATAQETWVKDMPPGMRWNGEAGNVDGVVSLVLEDPGDSAIEDCLRHAAKAVAKKMRAAMPQCPVQAVTGTSDSYVAAYAEMAQARRDARFLIDSPPVPAEVILAKPCDQCRAAAAIHSGIEIIGGEKQQALCGECDERLDAAGRTAGKPHQAPWPERRLTAALAAVGMIVGGFPDTFEEMAGAGSGARPQLALIYADGNKVGAFLSEAAKQRTGRGPAKADIVPALEQAAINAVADAVRNRFTGWSRPPVLLHVAGGDDILVSVPAVDAWLFARTLIAAFGSRIDQAARSWPPPVREKLPSLSAGMVFHHTKAPFSDVVRLAGDQLHEAKHSAEGSAVAFLDLTSDGSLAPEGRKPLTLGYLDGSAARLNQIEVLIPNSRRETLLAYLRQNAAGDFIRRLTDLPNEPLWEVVAGPGADAEDARIALKDDEDRLLELRRILDVARYWHAEPRTELEVKYP